MTKIAMIRTVVATVFAVRAYAQPQPVCSPTIDANRDVLINALTGDQEQGPIQFKKQDRAKIVFYNVNPFAWQYRFTVKVNRIDDSGVLSKFAGLLGGVIGDLSGDPAKASVAADAAAKADASLAAPFVAPEGADKCERVNSILSELQTKRDRLNRTFQDFQSAFDSVKASYDLIRSPSLVCPALLTKTNEFSTQVPAYQITKQKLFVAMADLKTSIQLDQAELAGLKTCDQTRVKAEIIAGATLLDDLATRLKSSNDDDQRLRAAKTAADSVINDPNAFYIVRYAGPVDAPSNVKITTARRDASGTADFQTVGEDPTINFGGGARFSIGAGVAFTPLSKVDYVRVQGAQKPSDLPGNLQPLIGVKERSSSRLTPIAMLHARVHDFTPRGPFDGLYLSLGVTAKNDNKGTDIDYLIGPSVSMLEHRLLLTAGAYVGKKQALEGNLYPGAPVPSSLAEIPVRKDFHWSAGFAITYVFPIGAKK